MNPPAIVLAYFEGMPLLDDDALDRLAVVGRLLDRRPLGRWDDPRADELFAEADVLVGHWGCPPIDAAMLDRATGLKMVAYAAGTVKRVITDAVWDRDLLVTSGADANAEPVAEFTVATVLYANKGVFSAIDRERGRPPWQRPSTAAAIGNWDKAVGIVSASHVGRRVAALLAPYEGIRVEMFDPFASAADITALGASKVDDLAELCARADVLSIHAPALPATHGLIGAAELAALRDGATVINTARGHCLDLDALVAELETGRLFAVIDVTDPEEPVPDDHPLRRLPNAVLTPHVAGSQGTELGRMSDWVLDEVDRFATGRPPRNAITRDMIDRIA